MKKGSGSPKGKTIQPESVSMSMGKGGNGMSMHVRKINNGYIVRKSGYVGKKGNEKYVEREHYTPTNPVSVNMKFGGKK